MSNHSRRLSRKLRAARRLVKKWQIRQQKVNRTVKRHQQRLALLERLELANLEGFSTHARQQHRDRPTLRGL